MQLPALSCSGCGREVRPRDGEVSAAGMFDDCLRRCDDCGFGWSNSSTSPVRIFRDAADNVPEEVRPGLMDAINSALNERNRSMKRRKLASASSEDAVTWTVFKFLTAHAHNVEPWRFLLGAAGVLDAREVSVLLCGVPIVGANGTRLREQLISTCDLLGEVRASRTEPDVIVDLGMHGLVFVEVKYRSSNDAQADKPWLNYTGSDVFADAEVARASGRYELARNWRIGCELAGGRRFALINLLPRLEVGNALASTDRFAASLRINEHRRVAQVTFHELLMKATDAWPAWFATYVARHDLISASVV